TKPKAGPGSPATASTPPISGRWKPSAPRWKNWPWPNSPPKPASSSKRKAREDRGRAPAKTRKRCDSIPATNTIKLCRLDQGRGAGPQVGIYNEDRIIPLASAVRAAGAGDVDGSAESVLPFLPHGEHAAAAEQA